MADIERKAAFYLGRVYDPDKKTTIETEPIMYDARDLVTHAVCIGMTGSGKTGLCVDLLEEAALDDVPAIIIDPKGDMTNLLLTFPDLLPSDFAPWVNADDARRKDQTVEQFAAAVAAQWSKGLADWGQSGERIRRLKEAAEFTIYTPGSDAGVPVSILHSFDAPDLSWDDDEELIREQISATASALLGLVGIQADPVRSREHILLANILESSWRDGQNLDLAQLIYSIQRPPMKRLGVLDVDAFYPEKDRFDLAMRLNSVAASPSFANWMKGQPLDVASIIRSNGKPRVAIFYTAHLNDDERMFFTTLLLQQVLSWMRKQSGTTSLRALLYMDEVYGYFPPYPSNPPSKQPLMSLLKTARAFGLGIMLTTQNPVDLDYKGLTNAGTWFIGKLQTDRDKARMLEGLEGVTSEAGTLLDRDYLDRTISSLASRVFVLHNTHAGKPVLFQTRWAMSYLRGPLTRSQVRTLTKPLKEGASQEERAAVARAEQAKAEQQLYAAPSSYSPVLPRLNARVPQYYLPIAVTDDQATHQVLQGSTDRLTVRATHLLYDPHLVGLATVIYPDAQAGQHEAENLSVLVPVPSAHSLVQWHENLTDPISARDLAPSPTREGLYGSLPDGMTDSTPYTQYKNDLAEFIYREHTREAWAHRELGLESRPGESQRDFAERCQEEARKRRDAELDRVTKQYETQASKLQTALEREQAELEQDLANLKGRRGEELLSAGETVVSLLMGRKRSSALSRASTKRRMTSKAKADVAESEAAIAKLEKQIADVAGERDRALQAVRERWSDLAMQVQPSAIRPKKSDIRVQVFGLAWVPNWLLVVEDSRGRVRDEVVPAYPAFR